MAAKVAESLAKVIANCYQFQRSDLWNDSLVSAISSSL